MSHLHGYGRFARILRALRLIEKNEGVLSADLAALGPCTERTVHRDILIMRKAGENIVCRNGRYYRLDGTPTEENDPLPPRQKKPSIPWTIFRKWYRTEARGDEWYVVRADQKDDPGYHIGRVGASGKKNFYLKALAIVKQRNEAILVKRQKLVERLQQLGWTSEKIHQEIANIQAAVKEEIGPDYQEDMR